MDAQGSNPIPSTTNTENQAKKSMCCVCKETKTLRDDCIRVNGFEKCDNEIATHNACLRKEGFNV